MQVRLFDLTNFYFEGGDTLFIRQPPSANRYAAEIYNALGFKQSAKSMRKNP
jgi:hypothetical protein